MANMDYETCYSALELQFGAGLKEINERWRKLSRVHHPDRHARDPKKYLFALEKQKQLNNARDVLKKWFELNPNAMPPRNPSKSQQTNSQSKSTGANQSAANNNSSKAQSNNTNSHAKQGTQNQQRETHTHQNQQKRTSQSASSDSSQSTQTKTVPNTGWFTAPAIKLTPLQELAQKIDNDCRRSNEPSLLAIVLGFGALLGPLFVISRTLGAIFDQTPGHYSDWLEMIILLASGWSTCYIFRWFFAEVELIKLQQKEMYFHSVRTISDTADIAKSIISKHTVPDATWNFAATGAAQEATLHFEEEVFPEVKRPRCLKIRFEARPGTTSVVFAVQFKATSPINSFACKSIAAKVVTDLKKELQEIAA